MADIIFETDATSVIDKWKSQTGISLSADTLDVLHKLIATELAGMALAGSMDSSVQQSAIDYCDDKD